MTNADKYCNTSDVMHFWSLYGKPKPFFEWLQSEWRPHDSLEAIEALAGWLRTQSLELPENIREVVQLLKRPIDEK